MHTASGGWGPVPRPQIVGHEIVGIATRVGSDIKHVKVGDLVGVGAQGDSCGSCGECSKHEEPYCEQGQTGTYAGKFKSGNGKGDQSYGGYSLAHRAKGRFVVKVSQPFPIYEGKSQLTWVGHGRFPTDSTRRRLLPCCAVV